MSHARAVLLLTALLASGAQAATPDAGTISPGTPSVAYDSGPFAVSNASLNTTPDAPECMDPVEPCDDFALTVDVPSDYATTHPRDRITITARWAVNQDAYWIYLLDAQGTLVASSRTGLDPAALSVPARPGTFTVRIVPSNAGGDLLAATVSLVADDTGGAPAGPAPSFANFTPDAALGENTGGEMSIGFNPKTSRVLTLGYLKTLRLSFGATPLWEDVSDDLTSQNTNDPILFTDPVTGRTFVSQLQAGTPGESLASYTDDDGDTWTQIPLTTDGGIDHQTVGGGPYPAGGGAAPTGDYPHAVYYCSQTVTASFCIRSDDGGDTFGPPAVMRTAADCDGFLGAIHGHVKVARDGTVYVPDRSCGGAQSLMVSDDAADTFTVKRLPAPATSGAGDPSVGVATDGTLYFCYLAADSHVRVAVSHDKGDSWVNDRDIGYAAGVVTGVFPSAVAGDPDRAACGFIGTSTQGAYESTAFEGIWYPYVATTYDGGLTWHTVNVSPGDPVQGTGGICLGGTTCIENRNLLDFNDMTVDDRGRPLFGYDDGCVDDCLLPPHTPSQICIPTGGINDVCLNANARTTVTRQATGRTLFAAFDGGSASGGSGAPQSYSLLGALDPRALVVLLAGAAALARRRLRPTSHRN